MNVDLQVYRILTTELITFDQFSLNDYLALSAEIRKALNEYTKFNYPQYFIEK